MKNLQDYLQKKFPEETQSYENSFSVFLLPFQFPKVTQNQTFLSWFLGFCEADASFKIGNDRGKVRLSFSLSQAEKHILEYIKANLGFGNVSRYSKDKKIYRFQCSSREDIHKLILFFNGNFILKKTTLRFEKWITMYNTLNQTKIPVISRWKSGDKKAPNKCFDHLFSGNNSILVKSSWLCGFIDGEGCFSASPCYHQGKSKWKLNSMFSLKQDLEPELLIHFYVLFQGGSLIQGQNKKTMTYQSSGEIPLKHIENYLKKVSLLTQKRWSFSRWTLLGNVHHLSHGRCSESEFHILKTLATFINKH